jgi:hypothetical protein
MMNCLYCGGESWRYVDGRPVDCRNCGAPYKNAWIVRLAEKKDAESRLKDWFRKTFGNPKIHEIKPLSVTIQNSLFVGSSVNIDLGSSDDE